MSFLLRQNAKTISITPVDADTLALWLKKQDAATKAWVETSGFTAQAGATLSIPDKNGHVGKILLGAAKTTGLYTFAGLPAALPLHKDGYVIDADLDTHAATQAALGWILGSYSFRKYKPSNKKDFATLVWPEKADRAYVTGMAEAIFMVRDLINTPANDLGPDELAAAASAVAKKGGKAPVKTILGEDLVRKNYPAVYEVGKASPRKPRLVDFRWGNPKHPKVTLVGKGVCYDTGGLNIKTENYMLLMKKDMGGAAAVLGLAKMIMAENLPINLRVLLPIVENSVAGNAFRPGDIIHTRKGLTVEIGNTDAEGRLILADALTEAASDNPDLIIDIATLTGAARAALGPDIPNLFCNDDDTANMLLASSVRMEDPLWRMPLWRPYADQLNSKIADTNNIGGNLGGHIIAALFLEKFVGTQTKWIHLDSNAYNNSSKPGRPEGGEALGIRACFDMLRNKYASHQQGKKRK